MVFPRAGAAERGSYVLLLHHLISFPNIQHHMPERLAFLWISTKVMTDMDLRT